MEVETASPDPRGGRNAQNESAGPLQISIHSALDRLVHLSGYNRAKYGIIGHGRAS